MRENCLCGLMLFSRFDKPKSPKDTKCDRSFQHRGEKLKVFGRERFRCTEEKAFLFMKQVQRALGRVRSDCLGTMHGPRQEGFWAGHEWKSRAADTVIGSVEIDAWTWERGMGRPF
ncbi:hypothetical protein ACMAUO_19615 [Gluconacetobacter sp. Hr-1-5]|uniref:hypothetical protein n=1 Tax=Gluconacetobacter sp. Hr-1-5 TaxID=3395370 RepID=UPI003B5217B3